ncbi:MAG: helix-turn-helix transcriptional regulator [Clostridia bacterium]|nr:helix-turn-helix transcriptional regulator [Clostridia bacterium]
MNKPISEKICEFRKARKLTQEQLGEKLGVSGQAVSKWENGTSMPDILLLPELCEILGISVDALLEMPVYQRRKNVVSDFCEYARETGRGKAVLDVIGRLFNDCGINHGGNNVFFSSTEIRVSDEKGMGFVLDGDEYKKVCLDMPNDDIMYFLRVLTDNACLSIIKMISVDDAVTAKEIQEALALDEITVDRILLGLMKRNLICVGIDDRGKRGYMQAANMVGIWMVLCGCCVAGYGGEIVGSFWMSRK